MEDWMALLQEKGPINSNKKGDGDNDLGLKMLLPCFCAGCAGASTPDIDQNKQKS